MHETFADMTLTSRPKADGFRMPAEWAPQECVWLLWPCRPDNYREGGVPAQRAYAAVADAILGATPVLLGVPPAARAAARATMPAGVEIVALESDDAWVRDTGPTIVVGPGGERRGVDWIFNAYGGLRSGLYAPWDRDAQVATRILAHHGFRRYAAPLVAEGGGVHVDGEGTLLVTEETHLDPGRNPGLTRDQVGALLGDYLGTTTTIWLPLGVHEDETKGHIDNIACFAAPGVVLLAWCDDPSDPQHARSAAALAALEAATDARGRRLRVHRLPQPGPLFISDEEAATIEQSAGMQRAAGTRLAGSYVNSLVTNGRVVVPLLDPATDAEALRVYAEAFPRHEIVGVPSREILLSGGNIHCITQQIPA